MTLAAPLPYDRVREHTAPIVNRRIDAVTRATIEDATRRGRDAIVTRLAGGITFALGVRVDRRWLGFFGAQMGLLLLHAVVGWCPPASLLRRVGLRTAREIEMERRALLGALDARGLAVRGDAVSAL